MTRVAHRMVCLVGAGLFAAVLSGCATMQRLEPKGQGTASGVFKPGDIVETRSGQTISFESLVEDLSRAQIIYLGETHTSIEDHRIQRRILERLHERNPSLTLAMEMFPKESQRALDRYARGLIGEEAFLEESRWKEVWGYSYPLYRPVIAWAQERGLPLVALNAPVPVVRTIARNGLDSLSPEERSRVALDMDFGDARHRNHIEEQFAGHMKAGMKGFETFYASQLAWEETMAETLAQTLACSRPGEQILVLIGNGHIEYRFGVPQRTLRRVEHIYRTVMPLPAGALDAPVDPRVADYVWITEAREPFRHGGESTSP